MWVASLPIRRVIATVRLIPLRQPTAMLWVSVMHLHPTFMTTLGAHMYDLVAYTRIRIAAMARTERGASAVEYGLLVALIALAIIAAVTLLGGNLSALFTRTANSISV